MIHADIYFLEEATGRMLAIVEDMQGTCSHALNRLASRPPSLTVIASAAAAERP